MRKSIYIIGAAIAAVAAPALASWSIDDGGLGFVGKGDVQLALGLNNAQMQAQAQARGLSFTYSDMATATVYCFKYHEETRTKEAWTDYKDFLRERDLSASVDYTARNTKQVNGFILKGWIGSPSISGDEFVCPGGFEPDYENAADNGADAGANYVITGATGGELKVNGVALDPLMRL